MKKSDLREKLISRKIKKPNGFLASIFFFVLNKISKKNKVEYHYGFDLKSIKNKSVVLLSTHASRLEFVYALNGFKEKNVNVVCGYQNIMKKYLYGILSELGVISKYLYQPDFMCTKSMYSVLKRGGNLALFPEGIQSISGSTHPINPATGKFLKRSASTIVLCKSEGAYLCQNRFSKDVKKGKIDFYYDILFTPDDLKNMTEEEIYDKLLQKFKYNEFKTNKIRRYKYVGKRPNVDGLDKIIYKCPHCGSEFKFKIEGENMACTDCGYTVSVNEYYDVTIKSGHKLYFDDVDTWFKWQRSEVKKELAEGFTPLEMTGGLYKLKTDKLFKHPKNKKILTRGKIILSKEGLKIIGDNLKGDFLGVDYDFSAKEVYSLTFSLSGFLEFYYENEYYLIYPDGDLNKMVKWTVCSEEIHNLYDPKWAQSSKDVYENNY